MRGARVTLTPVGAYRAALDNEVIVRRDVQYALWLTTLGVAVLLLLAFPRPLIGLLSMLPAMAGGVAALFVMTFIYRSISVMVLGFGGAIISITVDHGVAYFPVYGSPQRILRQRGGQRGSVGKSAGDIDYHVRFWCPDFFRFSDFWSAWRVRCPRTLFLIFIYSVDFPTCFPVAPCLERVLAPASIAAERLFSLGSKGALAALVIFIMMAFFAKPNFNVNLSGMNTVSRDTQAAEKTMLTVWGNIFGKVYLMAEAPSLEGLQEKGDQLLSMLEADPNATVLEKAFFPAMVFPGPQRSAVNLTAWKNFWSPERIAELRTALREAGGQAGFTAEAFDPFLKALADSTQAIGPEGIPAEYFALLGISASRDSSPWRQIASLALPPGYPGEQFYARYSAMVGIFEPQLFAHQLGKLISNTFLKLLVTIIPIVALIVLISFLDLYLSLIAMAPVLFAMVCTLGSLHLLGMPLDIPALVLTIIILGEGVELSLYVVTAYQRYGRASHPYFPMIRSSVLANSASTMIAFGVLSISHHSLLKSAGIASLLAISYSAVGTFLILPPILKRLFEKPMPQTVQSDDPLARVLARYRRMKAYARMFARFKLRLDPMFAELPGMVRFAALPKTFVDIGSGYGVPACWLAETFPTVRVYGIEPVAERARVASMTLGTSGSVVKGRAPDLPPAPEGADGAFMIDMIHFLSDDQLTLTLQRLHGRLAGGAPLTIRVVMMPKKRNSWYWWIDGLRNKLNCVETHWRSAEQIQALLTQCGYGVINVVPSGTRGDLLWACAVRV